jgi:hypothetical protein
MAVCGIHHDHVGAGLGQQRYAFFGAFANADRRADAQPAVTVLRRQRVFGGFENVFHRHQPAQDEVIADHHHALQTMLVHQRLGVFDTGAFRHGDQSFARGHDVGHRLIHSRFETQIAVGDDADNSAVVHHRQTGDAILPRQIDGGAHRHRRRNGDRILQHAGFETLDLGDFGRLRLRAQVFVHDADTAFLCHHNGQTGLGHRIHRRRNQRHVDVNLARQPGGEADIARQNRGMRGDQEDIVECQRLLEESHGVFPRCQKRIIRSRLCGQGVCASAWCGRWGAGKSRRWRDGGHSPANRAGVSMGCSVLTAPAYFLCLAS